MLDPFKGALGAWVPVPGNGELDGEGVGGLLTKCGVE